jgi:hypothetical protein
MIDQSAKKQQPSAAFQQALDQAENNAWRDSTIGMGVGSALLGGLYGIQRSIANAANDIGLADVGEVAHLMVHPDDPWAHAEALGDPNFYDDDDI